MFHIALRALPHMNEGSTIINTSSIQAYQLTPSILDDATTKGAIVTFTKGLAQEVIKKGICANTVAPGAVWTPFIVQSFAEKEIAEKEIAEKEIAEKEIAEFGKDSVMGRPAQPSPPSSRRHMSSSRATSRRT